MIAGQRARLDPADVWVGLGFLVAAGVEAVIQYRYQPAQLAINLAGALGFAALALRRVRPLFALTTIVVFGTASSLAQAWLASSQRSNALVPIFALLVACYSLGAYGTRFALVLGAPQPALLVLVVNLSQKTHPPLLGSVLFFAICVTGAPVLAGRLVRGRTALVNQLREQANQIEVQRVAQIGVAVASQRLRLAEQFQTLLVRDMQSLTTRVDDATNDNDGTGVAGIEAAARVLLAQTREAVVSLADVAVGQPTASDEPASKPPAESPRSDTARPWPWARPLPLITALWVGCALFAVLGTPLSRSTPAVVLSFVPPFLVAAFEPRKRAIVGLAVCCVGELACFGTSVPPSYLAVAVVSWIAGAVLHERLRLVEQLHANNALLDERREASARQAALQERVRIAHDLHDSVGHSLTVIALQAGAARRIWNEDPTRARAALDAIATVAHNGLTELRAGLEVGDDAHQSASVEDLLAGARAAGLHVDAHLEDTVALSGDARLAVYRIVQEALTNILKHATGATAAVTIRNAGSYVEVVVSNTAPETNHYRSDGHGHGLRGMRQRVEACGGQLTWGRLPDNGFEVRAQLPIAMATA